MSDEKTVAAPPVEFKTVFTTRELVDAVKNCMDNQKPKKAMIGLLGLDPEKGLNKINAALKKLKDQGVTLPDFRKYRGTASNDLTAEQVAGINQELGIEEKAPEEKAEAEAEAPEGDGHEATPETVLA